MRQRTRPLSDAITRRNALLIAGGAILVLVLAVAASGLFETPLFAIVSDPFTTTDAGVLTGAVSHLGVLLWWAGATIALFAAHVLRGKPGQREARRFLLGSGLISAYLTFDDLFLLHEQVLNKITPLPQPGVLAITALVTGLFLYRYRSFVRTTAWPVLLTAGAMFAASLAIDFVSDVGVYADAWELPKAATFLEESFKWFGIVAWATYIIGLSAEVVRAEP